MKKGIRYIRISKEGQSNFSIDGQQLYTAAWFERTGTELIATFIDEGYSAKNFDRPDFAKLEAFIQKHHKGVDYLVLNSFDRISRDAGEALVKIKRLQTKYGISVVSVSQNIIYDANDAGSAFTTGLHMLLAEDELIRHTNRVNQGIYTAKKHDGRYINKAPYGYINSRQDKKPLIVIDETKALIVKYMFDAYLSGTPMYMILKSAQTMGFIHKGRSSINDILINPVYTSLLKLKPFKELPGGMVEAIHAPIIDRRTWQMVNDKLTDKYKPLVLIDDEMPLRGVLKCHCGLALTGAPSTSRNGSQYYYYKCKMSKHNNISVIKAHDQLNDIFGYMSLRPAMITAIRDLSSQQLTESLKSNSQQSGHLKRKLEETTTQLHSVEEKFIGNQMTFETYNKWHNELTSKEINMKMEIDRLTQDNSQTWLLLNAELDKLRDVTYIYKSATTVQKQEFVRLVFDSSLFFLKPSYRTNYIMSVFAHNTKKMNDLGLLIFNEKADFTGKICLGGE